MTKYQFNQIIFTIILWSSIVIINLTTNLLALGWFTLVAIYSLYKLFTDVDTERD